MIVRDVQLENTRLSVGVINVLIAPRAMLLSLRAKVRAIPARQAALLAVLEHSYVLHARLGGIC